MSEWKCPSCGQEKLAYPRHECPNLHTPDLRVEPKKTWRDVHSAGLQAVMDKMPRVVSPENWHEVMANFQTLTPSEKEEFVLWQICQAHMLGRV